MLAFEVATAPDVEEDAFAFDEALCLKCGEDGGVLFVENARDDERFWGAGGIYAPFYCFSPITISSINGADSAIIDAMGDGRCVDLSQRTTLNGFTLRNGYSDWNGGGVYSGLFNYCFLEGNNAYEGGGAAYSKLTACVIEGNSAFYGGGTAYAFLKDCLVIGNSAAYGGGVYGTWNSSGYWSDSPASVIDCTLTWNEAWDSGGGAAETKLRNCDLTDNVVYYNGGGAAYAFLQDCLVKENTANNGSGGGIYSCEAVRSTLTMNEAINGGGANNSYLDCCVVSWNAADEGGGIYGSSADNSLLIKNSAYVIGGAASSSFLRNCTVSANQARAVGGVVYCDLLNSIVWGNTLMKSTLSNYLDSRFTFSCALPLPMAEGDGNVNIDTDPLFVDALNGDFRLLADSPCIDAGANYYAEGTLDLAGIQRILGTAVDMGAYEYGWGLPLTITFDLNGGTGENSPIEAVSGEALPSIVPPTRSDFTFIAYASAQGVQYYGADGSPLRICDFIANTTLTAIWGIPLNQALDTPRLVWTTSGDGTWYGQTSVSFDGEDAAQSSSLIDNQSASMSTTLEGEGTFSFRWKVSSESGYDWLTLWIDGDPYSSISGEIEIWEEWEDDELVGVGDGWEYLSFNLGEGTHTITFTYSKDGSVSSGADCGWVDQFVWESFAQETQTSPVPVPFEWLEQYPTLLEMYDNDYEATANATGANGKYVWESYVAGLDPTDATSLLYITTIRPIDAYPLTWSPDLSDEGRRYTIWGKTNLTDSVWIAPTEGTHFYRITVEMNTKE